MCCAFFNKTDHCEAPQGVTDERKIEQEKKPVSMSLFECQLAWNDYIKEITGKVVQHLKIICKNVSFHNCTNTKNTFYYRKYK